MILCTYLGSSKGYACFFQIPSNRRVSLGRGWAWKPEWALHKQQPSISSECCGEGRGAQRSWRRSSGGGEGGDRWKNQNTLRGHRKSSINDSQSALPEIGKHHTHALNYIKLHLWAHNSSFSHTFIFTPPRPRPLPLLVATFWFWLCNWHLPCSIFPRQALIYFPACLLFRNKILSSRTVCLPGTLAALEKCISLL